MKAIYQSIYTLLKEIPAIRWIDKDKGQLKFQRPPLEYPAALVKIEFPKCDDYGGKAQECDVLITVKLAFDFAGETSANTPAANLNEAMAFYDLQEVVFAKLQGYGGKELNALSRKRVSEEDRDDGLNVLVISFQSGFRDYTAG